MIKTVARAPCLLVMLDYDGTLSPIARAPDEADLVPGTLDILKKLSELPSTMVAVISGRAIGDLSERVPCPGIILVGNHGFECPELSVELPVPMGELRARAADLEVELAGGLFGIDGVLIENKGPVISVHYRRADPRRVIEIMNIVRRIAKKYEGVEVAKGKKVLELRPDLHINKGTAVQMLIDEARRRLVCEPFPLYAGDDSTDEDAFAAIEQGVTIRVGADDRPTCATHRVHGPAEMVNFLSNLEAARRAFFVPP